MIGGYRSVGPTCWAVDPARYRDLNGARRSCGSAMALLTRPPAPARLATLAPTGSGTPRRLTSMMVALAALGLAAGLTSVVGVLQRSSTLDALTHRSGPLTVQAQELYRALSDADATAAAAFLSNGQEPPALRQRYQNDVAAATASLAAATAADGAQPTVRRLAAQLPVYTGLVETARTYSRLNLPVGAAYLREASALMRTDLLVAAKGLYDAESAQQDADRGTATEFPWLAVPLFLFTIAGLAYAQLFLTRRTNRLFNTGLLAASVVAVIALGWITLSWAGIQSELSAAQRDGSSQVHRLAQARIDALQARADEALTLVARGNGGDFEKDYTTSHGTLRGILTGARASATDPAVRAAVDSALSNVDSWDATHKKLREADNGGRYGDAVSLTLGADQDAFNSTDAALAKGIGLTDATFGQRADAAAGALDGAAIGLTVLAVLMLAGLVFGFQQRIAEYR
jgi:hypothetical protein